MINEFKGKSRLFQVQEVPQIPLGELKTKLELQENRSLQFQKRDFRVMVKMLEDQNKESLQAIKKESKVSPIKSPGAVKRNSIKISSLPFNELSEQPSFCLPFGSPQNKSEKNQILNFNPGLWQLKSYEIKDRVQLSQFPSSIDIKFPFAPQQPELNSKSNSTSPSLNYIMASQNQIDEIVGQNDSKRYFIVDREKNKGKIKVEKLKSHNISRLAQVSNIKNSTSRNSERPKTQELSSFNLGRNAIKNNSEIMSKTHQSLKNLVLKKEIKESFANIPQFYINTRNQKFECNLFQKKDEKSAKKRMVTCEFIEPESHSKQKNQEKILIPQISIERQKNQENFFEPSPVMRQNIERKLKINQMLEEHEKSLVTKLQKLIEQDHKIREIYQQFFQIKAEQFCFHFSQFYSFVSGSLNEEDIAAEGFLHLKMGQEFADELQKIIVVELRNFGVSIEAIQYFESSFFDKAQKYLIPNNLFEDLGGHSQVQMYADKIAASLKESFPALNESQKPEQRICQMASMMLNDDLARFVGLLEYHIKNLRTTYSFVEFFVVQYQIKEIVELQGIKPDVLLKLIEQVQQMRYAIFPQEHYSQDATLEKISKEVHSNRILFKYFKQPVQETIQGFVKSMFLAFFGPSPMRKFLDDADKNFLCKEMDENFVFLVSKIVEEGNAPKNHRRIELFFIDLKFKWMYMQQFNRPKQKQDNLFSKYQINNLKMFCKEVKFQIEKYFQETYDPYLVYPTIRIEKVIDLTCLQYLLMMIFNDDLELYSPYDISIAAAYFKVTRGMLIFWVDMVLLLLKDKGFSEQELFELRLAFNIKILSV